MGRKSRFRNANDAAVENGKEVFTLTIGGFKVEGRSGRVLVSSPGGEYRISIDSNCDKAFLIREAVKQKKYEWINAYALICYIISTGISDAKMMEEVLDSYNRCIERNKKYLIKENHGKSDEEILQEEREIYDAQRSLKKELERPENNSVGEVE